ncbi:MAG: exodeoxyribonuclease III [Deltaproteobacteria bacterium]|jgi:exodeoxyribonuclease-3|nr:exodeoxyribonuclease III [Deltaproteobacteria bacterium]
MKLFSWNVNGIRAVARKGFFEWIEAVKPDIVGLQEVRASEEQLPEKIKSIPGYKYLLNAGEKKGYSGTATFYREDLEPANSWTGLTEERFNQEGRTLVTEYKNFILYNIYFPNGQKDEKRLQFKLDFYDALLAEIKTKVAQGKKIVVCGDYNTAHNEIDLKHPKSNSKRSGFLRIERDWLDKLQKSGFVDTYRHLNPKKVKYSWWSYRFNARKTNAGWRIDYFWISENLRDNLVNAEINDQVFGSDHCPVSLELNFQD